MYKQTEIEIQINIMWQSHSAPRICEFIRKYANDCFPGDTPAGRDLRTSFAIEIGTTLTFTDHVINHWSITVYSMFISYHFISITEQALSKHCLSLSFHWGSLSLTDCLFHSLVFTNSIHGVRHGFKIWGGQSVKIIKNLL